MKPDEKLVAQVEAILRRRKSANTAPTEVDLTPIVEFLSPTYPRAPGQASSSSRPPKPPNTHWYCSKAPTPVVRDAATFLIFLFAFQSAGTTSWIEALEDILKGCDRCSRAFGAARRTFLSSYLAKFNVTVHANFFAAVDKWQINFVLSEYNALKEAQPEEPPNLVTMASSFVQLLLCEPKFLKNVEIHNLLNKTIRAGVETPQPRIGKLGLTPVLIHLLGSSDPTPRKWAFVQLETASRCPISLAEWKENGIGSEFQRLYSDDTDISAEERWKSVLALLDSGGLSKEAIAGGMLSVEKGGGRGLMAVLCPLLGSDLPYFSTVFSCFTLLLRLSPTHNIWAFDTSPELPHTLFSDIKNNPAFLNLLQLQLFTPLSEEGESGAPALSWTSDFLLSLTESPEGLRDTYSGFSEALAKVLSSCFSELQHERFEQPLRAAAAKTGVEVLSTLQAKFAREDSAQQSSLFSALDIHAAFISNVALRPSDHPDSTWSSARIAAQHVLQNFLRADGKDIVESMLFLAVVAVTERKRIKKQKQRKPVDPPVKVTKFHRASIRKTLWTTAYNTALPSDPVGAAVMLQSIASFAHLDKLDRSASWSHAELGEVISSDDWVSGVRAVNQSVHLAREPFARVLQAIAIQPEAILQELWQQPESAKSAIICLLSPADDVHDPIISLVQQSFEEVDDRGDCFRILLQQFPRQAMDGLCSFLSSFIVTANKTPESCSLAKWLVRCFTDILEGLCQPSKFGPALLHSDEFLSVTGDSPMSRRVADLWSQMTTSLAVILKRTPEWAPYFDNLVMVDWMRDALIFGRQMADHVRIFEAAALGESANESLGSVPMESPIKVTSTGKKMIQQLDIVLRDLISWLRLTDVETLHQTFELVKTILSRISKSSAEVDPSTKETLLELDKFCRKVSKSYTTRLSDDLLSELSDLLSIFNLGLDEDASRTASPTPAVVDPLPRPIPDRQSGPSKPPPKDAFAVMMQSSASGSTPASKSKSKTGASRADAIAVDDFEDDFLDTLSAKDLDIIERRAVIAKDKPAAKAPPRPAASAPSSRPPIDKLNINVVPKSAPKTSKTHFKSQLMRDLQREQRQFHKDTFTAPVIGGISNRLPAASGLGTGLGAYQPKKTTPAPVESDSSASDSSEEEGPPGLAIARKQKSPLKPARTIAAPRVYQPPVESIWERQQREKEEARRRQINIKRRLKPDLLPLFRYILSWNPLHTGTNAPHLPHLSHLGKFTTIPTTFQSAQNYSDVMLPLFLQELWAQCIKDQVHDPVVSVEVGGRSYEDDFLDIDLSLPNGTPPKFQLHDSDIVIIKQAGNPRQVFAKVQGFQRNFAKGAIKIRILQKMDINGLAAKTRWQLQKHISLSTSLREYAALAGLPYYEDGLLLDILKGRSATFPTQSADTIACAQTAYDVNEPQAKAILGAMTINGFALIQGPPGTGKTKTISGLVGKWMSSRAAAIAQPGSERPTKAKLLVCAPSNAAIDEVCKRLMNGVPSSSGDRLSPTIVRIGVDSSVNDAVKDISLDNLVEAKVATVSASRGGTDYDKIQRELEEVKTKIREKQDQLRNTSNQDEMYPVLGNELQALITKRTQLGQASSKAKDAARDATRHLDAARRAAREAVLNDADIICATLSGSGQDSLSSYTFETVIIDEAAQAIEMSCLIPLKYGCRRCIMVGDPIQLPPTTFSTEADKYHFNESLFVRMTRQSSANVQLLSIQYRMHPYISELPSKVFYDSRLKDGPDMAGKTKAIWHSRSIFGAYRFFNVSGTEVRQGTSTKNPEEARVAVELYRRLEADFSGQVDFAFRIGIITMYREQLYEMKQAFNRVFGESILQRIEFNTVDGFQGQEKDIIILSCVRSGPNLSSIGFLKDPRRMNVALTRAKSSLWVIGNGPTLERSDQRWKTIVGDARDRGFFINYDVNTFARSPSPEPGEIPEHPTPAKKRPRVESASSPAKLEPSTSSAATSTNAGTSKKPIHIGVTPMGSSPATTSSAAGPSRKLLHFGSAVNATRAPLKATTDLKRKSNASTTSTSGPARKKVHPSSPTSNSSDTDDSSESSSSSDSDNAPRPQKSTSSTVRPTVTAPPPMNGTSKPRSGVTPLPIPPIRPAMARPVPPISNGSSARPLPVDSNGANVGPSRPRPPPPGSKPEDSLFIKKKKKKPNVAPTSRPTATTPIRERFNKQLSNNPRP